MPIPPGPAPPALLSPARTLRWSAHDLVVLGVFSAAAKLSTLVVALAGGGINPVTLLLKNLIFTTMLVVMLYKVRTPGTLVLFVLVNMLVSLLLLGGSVTLLPSMLGGALLGEAAAFAAGGLSRPWGPVLAVGVYDLSSKILSLGMSWLTLRESPGMLVPVAIIVALGYAGSFMGLFSGVRAVRELRHAGIVRS